MRILVTGATGYIGGRLAPRLIDAGHDVRALVRDAGKLRDVPWAENAGDRRRRLGDAASVERAVEGIEVLYFLVHGMAAKGDFGAVEREGALNVARAAKAAGGPSASSISAACTPMFRSAN